jgi:hypothetical protein
MPNGIPDTREKRDVQMVSGNCKSVSRILVPIQESKIHSTF